MTKASIWRTTKESEAHEGCKASPSSCPLNLPYEPLGKPNRGTGVKGYE